MPGRWRWSRPRTPIHARGPISPPDAAAQRESRSRSERGSPEIILAEHHGLTHLAVKPGQVVYGSTPVGRLKLNPDTPAPVPDGDIHLGANAGERRQYSLAAVGPEAHAAHDEVKLEGPDVTLVGGLARHPGVEGLRLADVPPDGLRPVDPLVIGDIALDGHLVGTGLLEDQQVVSQGRAQRRGVTLFRDEHQRMGLGADRLRLR